MNGSLSVQVTLSNDRLEDIAVAALRKYEPEEGYYLAFSGGKDSVVIYHLAEVAGVKFDAHFSMTTVDPPEVLSFIRENYPGVTWEKPKKSMFKLISENKIPPSRHIRYCCRSLKELHGKGRTLILGIRKAESFNRRSRILFQPSELNPKTWYIHPILEWKDIDVWDYIRRNGLKYCSLYDEGYTRIGCIMCPLQGTKGMLSDAKKFPKTYKAYLKAFSKMLKNHTEKDKTHLKGKTAEEVMKWWIYGDPDFDDDQGPTLDSFGVWSGDP